MQRIGFATCRQYTSSDVGIRKRLDLVSDSMDDGVETINVLLDPLTFFSWSVLDFG